MSDKTREPAGDSAIKKTRLSRLFGRHLPLERETTLFILASALDVFMTWILLYYYRSHGYVESNPIAQFFLDSWGIRGMVYFKFALVAFVVFVCQVIALKREDIASRILKFGTVVVACVVIYSFTLLLRYSTSLPQELLSS